jgi:hypothetical protein
LFACACLVFKEQSSSPQREELNYTKLSLGLSSPFFLSTPTRFPKNVVTSRQYSDFNFDVKRFSFASQKPLFFLFRRLPARAMMPRGERCDHA